MPTNQTSAREVERMTIAVGEALGLFPSCIKSGEDWSPTCQSVLEAARDALTRLTAAALTADRGGWMRCQGEGDFQRSVDPWLLACFGETIARDREERNHRFIEEALELVQANGCTASEAHQLVDYVYGRPVGDPVQEVGGVMVTLAALCLASGLDMRDAGETELARIWTKVEAIRAKQSAKPKHSPLPEAPYSPPSHAAEPIETCGLAYEVDDGRQAKEVG